MPRRPLGSPWIQADVHQADTDPDCILCPCDAFPALSSRLLFYGGISLRMKKRAYKLVGSLVKSILTRHAGSPSVETHSGSHVNSNPRVSSADAQRGESRSDCARVPYSFVAVIPSAKQVLNILNIFHRNA